MGKAYIVQEPLRKDHVSGQMVPVMDFRPVLEYGEAIVCLKSGRIALSPAPMIDSLKEVLKDFSDDDYLVAVGDPSAIAAAASICSNNNRGKFKLLKWDKESRRYISVAINIF